MRNQQNIRRDNYKFVATMTQGECQVAVSRQSHNNSKHIQHLNIVMTNINFVAKNTSKENLEDNNSNCHDNGTTKSKDKQGC